MILVLAQFCLCSMNAPLARISSKTSFIKSGGRPDLACGPQLAKPRSRMFIPDSKIQWYRACWQCDVLQSSDPWGPGAGCAQGRWLLAALLACPLWVFQFQYVQASCDLNKGTSFWTQGVPHWMPQCCVRPQSLPRNQLKKCIIKYSLGCIKTHPTSISLKGPMNTGA